MQGASMYYMYVLKNEEGSKYIGYTSNFKRRFEEHNQGLNQSTKCHKWELIYYEAFVQKMMFEGVKKI